MQVGVGLKVWLGDSLALVIGSHVDLLLRVVVLRVNGLNNLRWLVDILGRGVKEGLRETFLLELSPVLLDANYKEPGSSTQCGKDKPRDHSAFNLVALFLGAALAVDDAWTAIGIVIAVVIVVVVSLQVHGVRLGSTSQSEAESTYEYCTEHLNY